VVHADGEPDRSFHREIARRGAWVEFDGIGWRPIAEHVELILDFLEQCGPDRLLLSHDAGWYWVGEPNDGRQRPFTPLADELLPALAARGVAPAVLEQLVRENPARAFSVTSDEDRQRRSLTSLVTCDAGYDYAGGVWDRTGGPVEAHLEALVLKSGG
jgi:predicted metal-dependent phosphotriesterase family hydrolase